MSFKTNYNAQNRLRHVILSIASGLILALALPKPGMWAAAWIGLVPLFVALNGIQARWAAIHGLITGIVYYGVILHWVTLFGNLPWALLVIYQAIYIAVFAALCSWLQPEKINRWGFVAVPAAWVTLQFIRTLGPYGFIWGSFAHTQAENLPIAQIASITGSWGIDFLVCLAALAVATAISSKGKQLAPLIIAAVLTLSICLFGITCLHAPPIASKAVPVAIIQGNMKNDFNPPPDYTERAYDLYSRLSIEAVKSRPELILWPETTLPVDLTNHGWDILLEPLAKNTGADLLVGGYDPSKSTTKSGSYNALHLYNAQGQKAGIYRKVQLVPFGEFVPLRDYIPWLANYGIRPDDVLPGQDHTLLDTKIGKVGVSICFESTFPSIARGETLKGAELLCIVTNDAWLQRTPAAREHMMMSKLRAIENRRFVLRAAGTGISTVIDPFGRTLKQLGIYRQGIIQSRVCPRRNLTFYARFGDWFTILCIFITVFCLLGAIASRGKRHQGI